MEQKEKSEEAAADDSHAGPSMTVIVKFRGKRIPVSLSPESTVEDLKYLLCPLTNTVPRFQKLISKGKVLANSESLESLQITSNTRIMMIPSYSLPPMNVTLRKPESSVVPNLTMGPLAALSMGKSPSQRWRISGVVALGRRCLKDIPDEVWYCASHVKTLDISNNCIQKLPEKIGTLMSLNKLYLHANDLSDEKISWDGLTQLKSLSILSFNCNSLTSLPPSVGSLTSLTDLFVVKNKLTSLPDELGCLNKLRVLLLNCNRISSVPATIGNCSSLLEINFSDNCLTELPETFANLRSLEDLILVNNGGLNSLPSNLLRTCTQLELLRLNYTGITLSRLRQMDGYREFAHRRSNREQLDLAHAPTPSS